MASDMLAEKVVYTTSSYDPATRLPLVVINSIGFPTTDDDNSTNVMEQILSRLPTSPYALIFFACGAPNRPSWAWLTRVYNMLSHDMKKRVGKVYLVHESWWVRAVTEMFTGITSSKFSSKISHISSLSELATNLDITQFHIPIDVYLYNLKIESTISVPKYHPPVFNAPLRRNGNEVEYPKMWTECCDLLSKECTVTPHIFQTDVNNDIVLILRDAFDRGQKIDLKDYGPHPTASLLKHYLKSLPDPLLHPSYLEDASILTSTQCVHIFRSLPYVSQKFLYDLMLIFSASVLSDVHTPETIALCTAPSFLGHYTNLYENRLRAVRFVSSLVEYWPDVEPSVRPSGISSTYYGMNTSKESLADSIMSQRAASNSSMSSTEDVLTPIDMSSKHLRTATFGSMKLYSSETLPQPPKRSMSTSPVKSSQRTLRKSASTTFQSPVDLSAPPGYRPLRGSHTFSGGDLASPRPYLGRAVSTKRGKMVSELAKLYE